MAAEAIEDLYPQRRQEFLFVLAEHYHRSGTADKAAFYLEQAAKNAAKIYNNKDAISLWEKLLEWLPQLQAEPAISVAKVWLEISELKSMNGDWEGAQESLKLAQSTATTNDELFDLQRLQGILAFRKGDFASAIKAWETGLELAENSAQYAIAHGNLGIWHQHHKDWEKAFTHHEKSLEYAEQAQDSLRTAKTLSNLALMYIAQKDYAKAEKYLQNSLELCDNHQFLQLKSIVLGNLGWLRYRQKNLEDAMHYYERKWTLVDKIGDTAELIKVLGNIGNVYRDKEEHQEALAFYQKVLALKERLKNSLELAITHNAIADELKELGEYKLALEHITQAVSLAKVAPNKQCEYLFYQAEILKLLGKNDEAKVACSEAKEMAITSGRTAVKEACDALEI